jgi:DNA-binding transcriptional ArsR family regulator/predicted DNA-binding transcriptional regulator
MRMTTPLNDRLRCPWYMVRSAMHDETVRRLLLQLPNRRRTYEAIVATPGTHVRRLSRELGIALGVVEHHVRQLHRHGLLFSHQAGRRKTLYAQGQVDPADAKCIHALRKPGWARIAQALLAGGECGVARLAGRIGEPPAATSYTLRRMRAAGLLEHVRVGREGVYVVSDPDRVRRLLTELRPESAGAAPDPTFVGLVERARSSRPGVPLVSAEGPRPTATVVARPALSRKGSD